MTEYGIGNGVTSLLVNDILPAIALKNTPRPVLYRIQSILHKMVNGERVTASCVARELEVSPRTVARDIAYLIDVLHVPMLFDYSRKTYILNGPIPILLGLHILPGDATDTQGIIEEVVLELDRETGNFINGLTLHPSQSIKWQADGTARLNMQIRVSEKLIQWILSYAGRIRPISPVHLCRRVGTIARSMLSDEDL